MAPQTQPKLPVIDFNTENLNPGTEPWSSTSVQVRQALEDYGCFVLANYDKVPSELHNTIFSLSKDLFNLPMETKTKNTSDILGFGYGGNFASMPLLEYFGIEDGATLEATRTFTNLLFPSGNDHFCETAYEYTKKLSDIDHCVMRMVFESYGVDIGKCEHLTQSSLYLVRFMKYRPPQTDRERETGLHTHTDKSFLAVLGVNEVEGLEVETKTGEWISFAPSPSTFVVVAGEPFMAWSNGRIYAPAHRVAMRSLESKVRYSIVLFSFMRETIEVPQELVDDHGEDEAPLKFRSFNHFEFLEYCGVDEKKFKGAIKSYCGTA